jgi:TonB-dependent receptor
MHSPTTPLHGHKNPRAFAISPVAAACALLIVASGAVSAQTSNGTLDSVVVTGIRRSIEDSVAIKRGSDSIVEVVSAEELGKLPDASIAEALARLPGVTGQRGPDGRVNVISIRGLSPEFSGSLLNGREIVSSNDARTVEYDQFPSELIGSAVVYKTPDGTLIGQGLSGTVDLRARRPLDTRGREIAVNLRGETNSNGDLAPGVASPIGKRFSISYIDQFANNTVGVALGFARLDVSTQVKQTELVQYGDFTPYGLPLTGNAPSRYPITPGGATGQSLLPMFFTATSSTKKNTRDGLMAVLEFKPNADLHSTLDLYYSKFDTHEVGGKFLTSMFANWGANVTPNLTNLGITQIGQNTLTTSATASQLPVTTGNFDTTRSDTITALGWNTEMKLADKWKGMMDLSFSRDVRRENYSEAYAGPYDSNSKQWVFGGFNWNVPVNGGAQTYTPLQSNLLSDPSRMALGDVPGFDFVSGNKRWIGAVRHPEIQDDIKSLRLSGKRELDGMFSSIVGGVNYTQRNKDVAKNEDRILAPRDANGDLMRSIPTSVVGTPFDMGWAGIPSLVRIDVPSLARLPGYSLEPGQFNTKADNDSNVQEKVLTAFGKLDIETNVGGIPVRGNVGLQVVNARQSSEGWQYLGNVGSDDVPNINLLFKRTGSANYTDILPSLNLIADFQKDLIGRFGLAKTLARPNIVDMRAGTSTPTVITGVGPDQGKWTMANAGNPELEPWRATAIDFSLEKYFGKRSYISGAVFRKNLQSYVFNQVTAQDNSGLPVSTDLPAGIVVQRYGPVTKPTNGQGGTLTGLELSASLEGGLLHSALTNFGLIVSASRLTSEILDQEGNPVVLNGLSGTSASATVYYEQNGFSARVSERYRSPFTASTRDIFLNSTTRKQEADKTVDLQLGYAFEQGPYKGLSFLFQINNLLDSTTQNSVTPGDNAPDKNALYPNYTYQFGRQTLLGVNYKF